MNGEGLGLWCRAEGLTQLMWTRDCDERHPHDSTSENRERNQNPASVTSKTFSDLALKVTSTAFYTVSKSRAKCSEQQPVGDIQIHKLRSLCCTETTWRKLGEIIPFLSIPLFLSSELPQAFKHKPICIIAQFQKYVHLYINTFTYSEP